MWGEGQSKVILPRLSKGELDFEVMIAVFLRLEHRFVAVDSKAINHMTLEPMQFVVSIPMFGESIRKC
jgi:hypothetical protein